MYRDVDKRIMADGYRHDLVTFGGILSVFKGRVEVVTSNLPLIYDHHWQ